MILLRVAGFCLLLCTGGCIGLATVSYRDSNRRRIHDFGCLLAYLAEFLQTCALTGPELLLRAARRPLFAPFCPPCGGSLGALQPPRCLSEALRCEISETLFALEEMPRQGACAALRRLADLCEAESAAQAESLRAARRLWPKLGACLGALTAVLLW